MARIEGFRVKNFKVLKDVTLGRLWNQWDRAPLAPMAAVIGKNGVGKSALVDAFGFLADALTLGVEDACDARGRGGFTRLRTMGESGPIEFELYYRQRQGDRPITYEINIDQDNRGRPCVTYERLRQRRRGQKHGRPFSFLWLEGGEGIAWKGEQEAGIAEEPEDFQDYLELQEESWDRERVELANPSQPGVATLAALKQHSRIAAFRRFITGWHLSYFSPDAARSLPLAGPQKHLGVRGDNLGNVVQFMKRAYPERFTHQPYFVDSLEPEEVWILEKGADGCSTVRRASDDPVVTSLVAEGLPLGGLWYSDYLDAR